MANDNIQIKPISSPYNFVPLNKQVLIPDWCDKISQDVPFSDGEDGSITITLHNTTPIYIKGGVDKDDCLMSCVEVDGRKRFFLPATSLKGMLRSVLEILSFSQMEQFDNDYIGFREFDTHSPLRNEFSTAMENASCGWLHADDEDTYWIEDCGDIETVPLSDVDNMKTGTSINGKILIHTGKMQGKKVAYLFSENGINRLTVEKSVFEKFLSVYKPSPIGSHETYLKEMEERMQKDKKQRKDDVIRAFLRSGGRLPVFFSKLNGKVMFIGLSRQFRYPMKHSIAEGVKQEICVPKGVSRPIDMAKCIFGFTTSEDSLRGRVQVGHAFCKDAADNYLKVKGVLGQPHPSFYPLYVKQDKNGSFFTYETDGYEIAGRKRYRVHADNAITEIPQGNGNEKVMTKLSLLPESNRFEFKIHVHNLRPVETGALLSALTFHNAKSCHHLIGMGKSFGYGKLEIDEITLKGFSKTEKEYLQVFETFMKNFDANWLQSPQLRMLFAIAEDHGGNDRIKTMNLSDFKGYKINSNYQQAKLHEPERTVESLFTPLELKKNILSALYQGAQSLNAQEKYADALGVYKTIQKELLPLSDTDVEEAIRTLQEKVEQQQSQLEEANRKLLEQQIADEKAAAQARVMKMNFEQYLESVPLSSPAAFKGKIERDWVHIHGELSVEEKNLAKKKVETYLSSASKKVQKRWSGFTI